MVQQDIRWIQRFNNYRRALAKLTQAVRLMSDRMTFDGTTSNAEVDELLKEGIIQRFEYTHELAWKVMKDYAEYQGYTDIRGSRDALHKAFEMGLIGDRRWMESIEFRSLTYHYYDDEVASEIYETIMRLYYPLLCAFEERMRQLADTSLL